MSRFRFDEELKKLNSAQREAVEQVEGPVMVVAGPGTGKTQVLAMRIGNILRKTDTAPESVLALTFTDSAAHNLRRRLTYLIGLEAYRVRIFTFHGFCNEVIQRFGSYFPRIAGASAGNVIDQIDILEGVIARLPLRRLKPFGNPFNYVRDIVGVIGKLKRENIDPDKLESLIASEPEKAAERNQEFLKIYREYETQLRARKLYDYDDMIMEVIRQMRAEPDLLAALQEEIQYVLADEHQDANAGQNELLSLLLSYHENPNLFVVGDEWQAIYRFQGASLENFAGFKRAYPAARVINLTENYRSRLAIVRASGALARGRDLRGAREGEGAVTVIEYDTEEAEILGLRENINRLIKKGVAPDDIAVLYRDNKDVLGIVRIFEKSEVPFIIESDQDILEDVDIRKLINILRAVDGIEEKELLVRALHADFLNVASGDIYRFIREGKLSPKLKNLTASFHRWHKLSRNKGLVELFEIVARASGFLAHLLSLPDALAKLEKLTVLFEELKTLAENHRHYALPDFIRYLDLLEQHKVLLKRDTRPGTHEGVHLLTAHRSKGQEFDFVFIVGVVDGHFGGRSIPDKISFTFLDGKDEDEEKRLFYVALTRAREEVTISYARKRGDGRENLPSRFVEELRGSEGAQSVLSRMSLGGREHAKYFVAEAFKPKINHGPKISDKTYARALFDEQGLSVTALNNFLRCPWQYFYVNLLRLPTAFLPHQMYGTAVHAALSQFSDKRSLLKIFEQELCKQPLSEREFDVALERGRKALGGYYDFYKGKWPKQIIKELAIKGVELDGVRLTGRIDKLELLEGSEVNVVDYKTGKPKSRNDIEGKTKSSAGDIKRQLVFYKILLDNFVRGRYRMVSGEIDFVEPNDRGYYKKERFEVTDDEVKELKEQISDAASQICSLSFWNSRCLDKACEWCALRTLRVI